MTPRKPSPQLRFREPLRTSFTAAGADGGLTLNTVGIRSGPDRGFAETPPTRFDQSTGNT